MGWKMGIQRIKNKYKNSKVVVDGIKFDSKKEAGRYITLKSLEKDGIINGLKLQVKYLLIPTQYELPDEKKKKRKVLERECSYYADFVYYKDGKIIVEDTKGMRTPEYIIKRKLMLYVYGIKIKEV